MNTNNKDIVVYVEAKDFVAGEEGTTSTLYPNLVTTAHTATGHVEWLVNLPHAGKYYLHARMTSLESRPCTLNINGKRHSAPILSETTGGWHADTLQWFVYGPYEFKQGLNLLGLGFSRCQPHLREFGFAPADSEHQSGPSGHESFQRLREGYARYRDGKPQVNPTRIREEIQKNANSQHPFAIVLACADSRVPPEIIFDQDIGDLFVLRVAGNVADTHVLGSIQYALEHLGTKLIVVLGHERCGAIAAALSVAANRGAFSGPLGQLVSGIVPWIEPVYRRGVLAGRPESAPETLDEAVCVNVKRQIATIRDALENLGQEALTLELWLKEILVVGARYDLDCGTVEFFETPADHRPKRIGLLAESGLGVAVDQGGALLVREGQDFNDFELHAAGGTGWFALKSANGKFVSVAADGTCVAATSAAIGDAERFCLVDVGDKRFALRGFEGRYLSAPETGPMGTAAEARVREYFRIIEVDE